MSAYYNEYDPKAAAWLRQLIKNGLIADGEVDERSITEVESGDLKGFVQHHFFSGIGGWSYALRLAGWSDDRVVCTASLPCQPFSVAGAGKGKADERHLLPYFIELVKQCNFGTIFGEQVPAAIKYGWVDDLQAALEEEGYAMGHCVLGAHSAGAPHIRQRSYWVADSTSERYPQQPSNGRIPSEAAGNDTRESIERSSELCWMGNMHSDGCKQGREAAKTARHWNTFNATSWSNPEWLYCRDNKYRPIKPGIKPLVDGVSERLVRSRDPSEPIDANNTQEARVMRLKGYGNAICVPTASAFIHAFMSLSDD